MRLWERGSLPSEWQVPRLCSFPSSPARPLFSLTWTCTAVVGMLHYRNRCVLPLPLNNMVAKPSSGSHVAGSPWPDTILGVAMLGRVLTVLSNIPPHSGCLQVTMAV